MENPFAKPKKLSITEEEKIKAEHKRVAEEMKKTAERHATENPFEKGVKARVGKEYEEYKKSLKNKGK